MGISPGQWQVLKLLDSGHTADEISRQLSISRTALQAHIQAIRQSYGVFSHREAVEAARSRGDL